MSTAEDFLLIVTDPESGKTQIGSAQPEAVIGGAFLFDLVAAGRLALQGDGRKAKVVVADSARLDDPVLEQAFDRVRNRGPRTPQNTVTRLGKNGRKNVYAAMSTKGTVRPREESFLGVFPLSRHDVVDTARRDDLLARIHNALLRDMPADAQTGPIIGLLSAADLTKNVVDKPDRKRAKARAKVIAEGDWASEGVRKAIQAAQAAMTAAIVSASVAGSAGSN